MGWNIHKKDTKPTNNFIESMPVPTSPLKKKPS
jgi:hypothetical protein